MTEFKKNKVEIKYCKQKFVNLRQTQFERNSQEGSNVTLVKALAESISLNRLPVPEPAVLVEIHLDSMIGGLPIKC